MLPGQTKYFRLDLHPDLLTSPGGRKYTRHEIRELLNRRLSVPLARGL